MKATNQCPKCNSCQIIKNATPIDLSGAGTGKLSVATYSKPKAFLFKGQLTTTLSAWICADCGYVEFYADSPQSIKIKEP